jgi:hypothetical protein
MFYNGFGLGKEGDFEAQGRPFVLADVMACLLLIYV